MSDNNNIFVENAKIVKALIAELNSFTEKELLKAFRERIGEGRSMYIERWGVPVKQLLKDWSDLGILHNNYGHYTVVK